jgi:hypothetical protein
MGGVMMWRDGNDGVASTVNSASFADSKAMSIGRAQSFGEIGWMQGRIAEIVLVGSAVDVSTRQKIEGYLAHKWGLTSNLPSDHPYKTNPPTVSSPSNIILKINPGGANNDTTYTTDDAFARAITFANSAVISNAQSTTNSTSLSFPGTTSYVHFVNDNNLNLAAAPFTVDFDIRFASVSNGTCHVFFFRPYFFIGFSRAPSSWEVVIDWFNSSSTFQRFKTSVFALSVIPLDTWVRIRVVWPNVGTITSVYTYTDGTYRGTTKDAGTGTLDLLSGIGDTGQVQIGSGGTNYGTNLWTGFIDNITVYNEALSGAANYTP